MIALHPGFIIAFSGLLLMILFLVTWKLSVRFDNYSFVDVTWSLAFAPTAIWYGVSGTGWMPRRLAISALVALWSLRLGKHLWTRVASHHPKEDPRYGELRKNWQLNLHQSFLWFFLAQGLLVWIMTLPVFLICQQSQPGFHVLEYIGLTLWLVALIGEGVADAQLRRFKATSKKGDEICQVGLWHYSRHPNYFFQSLLWWGLFLIALPAPWGWITIIAPLAMLHFLMNVTGVPLTEKLAIAKRGDAYREYQRTTSALVPWFRKS